MASPIRMGSLAATPFISQYVDIIREHLHITPDEQFQTARFSIEYHLQARKAGEQIPLLFYAADFRESFQVWVDGDPLELQEIPANYELLEGTRFDDFAYLFATDTLADLNQILADQLTSDWVQLEDLKFFETDLSEGEHVIRVEYVADRWEDRSDWVKDASFRYVLAPAKYWKSFGTLDITLDLSRFGKSLTTNLPASDMDETSQQMSWTFSEIPTDVLEINWQAEVPRTAKTLIAISPEGILWSLRRLLAILHLFGMWKFRKQKPTARFSWVMIVGSLLVPLISLAVYPLVYEWIDTIIGAEASRYHGYQILSLFLYPIVLPIYLLVMALLDRKMKKSV